MGAMRVLRAVFAVVLLIGVGIGLALASYLGPPIFENVWRLPVADGERVVALTFDDGPNPPYTEQILEILEREGVRATFFMTGEHATRHAATARRVLAAGHAIGNHGWDHVFLSSQTVAEVRASLERTDAALRAIGVSEPTFVRAGSLALGFSGARVLRAQARVHVAGTLAANDWTTEPLEPTPPCTSWLEMTCPTRDGDVVTERVLSGVSPGAIIVLHDGHDRLDGADRSATVAAVDRIVPALLEDGYRFVTIPEGLRDGPEGISRMGPKGPISGPPR